MNYPGWEHEGMNRIMKNSMTILGQAVRGSRLYYLWAGMLSILSLAGLAAYAMQVKQGLIISAMRDQVSWGLYLSNFTVLVGVAAAAVLLVIPAYIYNFKPIREIVLFGEMLASVSIIMCIVFVLIDLGRPDRIWHILPVIGVMNFPGSLLTWDVLVLNGYLAINLFVTIYVLIRLAGNRDYSMRLIRPLVMLSIPWAVGIHTVTAFLYNGLAARPFWNASILAPRFLASAFCSGPAIMLVVFQVIRRVTEVDIEDRAIDKIGQLIAYAMGFNLFLLGVEMFKEFYSNTIHAAPLKYMYLGLHGHGGLVPWLWAALVFNIVAFVLLLSPRARANPLSLNLACILVIIGVYIEKGMGLIVPGFIPDVLGEIYEYAPTYYEIVVTVGVWALGALLYTLMLKIAIPIYTGRLRFARETA